MFLVAGDYKGGAKAPFIREAIFPWRRLLFYLYCWFFYFVDFFYCPFLLIANINDQ
ncbi:hypothetical protein CCP2SC5_100045 [Azospirillaceae bacterium]